MSAGNLQLGGGAWASVHSSDGDYVIAATALLLSLARAHVWLVAPKPFLPCLAAALWEDSKYKTNMKFEYLSYASTEPGCCCLMYIQAIAHRAFCSRKPEEVVLDPSDAADHRSVIMKAIPIVGYSNGTSCMKYSESSICLLIALQRVVYTQAPTTQSRITKDYSNCSLCGSRYLELR